MTDAKERFRKDVEDQMGIARKMLSTKEDTIQRMAVFRDAKGKLNAVMMPDIPPNMFPSCITHFTGLFAADRIYIIAEAWMSSMKPGDPYVKPSESDSRKEVILVYGLDRDTHSVYCLSQEINRHPDGTPFFSQDPVDIEQGATRVGGRFGKLLDALWGEDPSQQNSERLN